MQLERVTREPRGASGRVPMVFVHGAWHGAWCWGANFLPYFASRGHAAHAFDLRGHGGSEGRDRLRQTRITDYVADLASVVADLDEPPVLVGHAMGGAIVQKYLETNQAAAAALLATVPPTGAVPAALRMAVRHPVAALKAGASRSPYHLIGKPRLARQALFSADIPQQRLRAYFSSLQDESYRAFLDLLALELRPERVDVPVLVVGADRDRIISRKEVDATARAYGTQAMFFPMAHDMMLEDGWRDVADHIMLWMDSLGLAGEAA
jgi:pimeloyl-ACP methyl ester carboxylesterase